MPNPTRYVADVSGLVPWVADDILAGLPRAAPESAMEAMMMARRGAEVDTTPLPSEWARSEAERYGKGYRYVTRQRGYERSVPNIYGDIPDVTGKGIAKYVSVPPRGGVKRYGVRVPNDPPRPYPHDASAARQERRLANARAILESGRQNPEVYDQLPAVFKLPLNDDLLARLAAESPQVVLRKALQENPEIVGGLMGAGGVMGGGIAYGLLSDE
jgi:hypothetical protein